MDCVLNDRPQDLFPHSEINSRNYFRQDPIYHHGPVNYDKEILFSDESQFCISNADGRKRVRRRENGRLDVVLKRMNNGIYM